MADYPLTAFNNELYVSVAEYDMFGQFTGNRVILVNRNDVLNCVTPRVGFYANLTYPGWADRVGPIAPVTSTFGDNHSGDHEFWVASRPGGGNEITLFRYTPNVGLTSYRLPSQNYAAPPDSAQRDSGNLIDTGDSRVSQATDILLPGGNLWVTFALATACTYGGGTTQCGCVEWFKVCVSCVNGGYRIDDQGIFGFGESWWAFFPSAAIDASSQVVINYSISGTQFHPSAGSIVRGSSQYSDIYIQDYGTHTYNSGNPARWGDYSSIFLDPAGQNPGRTFWMSTHTTSAPDRWGTQISGVQSLI